MAADMSNEDKERETFEAWAKTQGSSTDRIGNRDYFWQADRSAWAAWQARASLAASAGSEPVPSDGWLHQDGLLYRLTDERRPCNRDEINVTMADGSRSIASRSRRALELLDRIRATHPSPLEGMVGGWISVDERLPKCPSKPGSAGVEVLIYPPLSDGSITAFYGRRQSAKPTFYKHGALVHGVEFWMAPPAPPIAAVPAQPDALLPCPFCGAAAHFETDSDGWHWIECESCGMQGNRSASLMEDCKPKLREAWNTRAGVHPDVASGYAKDWEDGMSEAAALVSQGAAERAVPADNRVPEAWTNLLAYVLQDDLHNRLTPRIIDIAYTAFMRAKRPNDEDGGASDWFNDTRPAVKELIATLRRDLIEKLAAAPATPAPQPAPGVESNTAWAARVIEVLEAMLDANTTHEYQAAADDAKDLIDQLRASHGQAPAPSQQESNMAAPAQDGRDMEGEQCRCEPSDYVRPADYDGDGSVSAMARRAARAAAPVAPAPGVPGGLDYTPAWWVVTAQAELDGVETKDENNCLKAARGALDKALEMLAAAPQPARVEALSMAQAVAPGMHREWRSAFQEAIDTMEAEIDTREDPENVRRMKRATSVLQSMLAAAPQPATADARPFPAFVDGLLWLCVMDAGTIKPLDGAAALPVPGSWKSVMLENWATQKDKP